jgi:sugar/nucleoside kinase (ribokinase family)
MNPLIKKALALLRGAEGKTGRIKALIGLDGFVDSIIRVVDKRHSADSFDPFETIDALSKRIARAAGRSANLEMVCEKQKLGGNGPIMANSLAAFGVKIKYVGNLGRPEVHPVFREMTKHCEVISIAEPSFTDALEFDDGKLMLTKSQALKEITWKNLKEHVGEAKLLKFFQEARFIALNNWTQIPCMSDIWEEIQKRIAPKLAGPKRIIFFDLADPEKRTPSDVRRGLNLISGFEKHFHAVLGLNESEARQIAVALEISFETGTQTSLALFSARIRQKLGISFVVIHPREFACAANESGETFVEGPFCAKPLISTGAGDHFNAGFSLGLLLGGDLEAALQIGVAVSGYYVRTAKSPTVADLRKFLKQI